MRYAVSAILGLTLLAAACSSAKPIAVQAGEKCYGCDRVISDTRYAAELITGGGEIHKFRTPTCMARYLKDHPKTAVQAIYVTDFTSGKLIPVSGALFVRAKIDPESSERDFVAYRSLQEATARATEEFGAVIDWSAVRNQAAAQKPRAE